MYAWTSVGSLVPVLLINFVSKARENILNIILRDVRRVWWHIIARMRHHVRKPKLWGRGGDRSGGRGRRRRREVARVRIMQPSGSH